MKNVLIIGCGLLGSSLVRKISKKKIAKKYLFMKNQDQTFQKLRD